MGMNENLAKQITKIAQKAVKLRDAGKAEGYSEGITDGKSSAEAVTVSLIDRSITEIDIPEGITVLGECALRGCTKLARVTLPASLKRIEAMAFYLIKSLTEIVIPDGVEFIGGSVFSGCSNLAKVTLPESVTAIGSTAFNGTSITEFVFPDKVSIIDDRIFLSCSKLKSVVAPSACLSIEEFAFGKCTTCVTYDFTKCKAVPRLYDVSAFQEIDPEAKIYVPASLYDEWVVATNWAACADHIVAVGKEYKPSEGLEYDYNEYAKSYGVVGLGDCTDTVLVIPEKHEGYPVTSVFMSDMDTVKEIVLPDTITVILSTLQNCDALERVSFGSGVTTILYWAFNGNVNCREYDFSRCEQVPSLSFYDTEPDTFIGMPEDCRIIVPAHLYDEWITATNWVTYADHIVSAI